MCGRRVSAFSLLFLPFYLHLLTQVVYLYQRLLPILLLHPLLLLPLILLPLLLLTKKYMKYFTYVLEASRYRMETLVHRRLRQHILSWALAADLRHVFVGRRPLVLGEWGWGVYIGEVCVCVCGGGGRGGLSPRHKPPPLSASIVLCARLVCGSRPPHPAVRTLPE